MRDQREDADAFTTSRACFEELIGFLQGGAAACLQHGELEQRLDAGGRELLRLLFQDHLDLRAGREEPVAGVAGPGGVPRRYTEAGHARPLATIFGQVTVRRLAYRRKGQQNLHPADGALNLPVERYSHGLRRLTAIEASRGSFDEAVQAIGRASAGRVPKRQAEQLACRAAAGFGAFYAASQACDAAADDVLVISADGKGIVMLPGALRKTTADAAARSSPKLRTRLSPGEKHGRKRMAELAAVHDAIPVPRVPGDIIRPPGSSDPAPRNRGPSAAGKWLTASVTSDIPAVIAAGFGEAARRDPHHRRTWIALVDGNNTQIDAIRAEAARRGITVAVLIDFVHVLELSAGPDPP